MPEVILMALTVVMARRVASVACCLPSAAEAAAEIKAALAEVSVVCSHLSPDLATSKAVLVVESLVSCHLSQAAAAMALVAVDCSAHETSAITVPPPPMATELHLKPLALRHKGTAATNSRDISNQVTNSPAMSSKATNSKATSNRDTAHRRLRASSRATTMHSPLLTSRDTRSRTLSRVTVSHPNSSHLKEGTARAATVSRGTTEDTDTRAARVADIR
jgi:hypothetical protein